VAVNESAFMEKLSLQGLLLLKGILRKDNLDSKNMFISSVTEDKDLNLEIAAKKSVHEFYTEERITEFCRVLVTKFLVISQNDYDMFVNDTEKYMTEEESGAWKYNLTVIKD
jgi:hypothetical protein